MSCILGLAAFHPDSSACVVVDGELKAAVSEERLGVRMKHDASFPAQAIRWALEAAGVTPRDLTHVAVARDTSKNRGAKIAYTLANPFRAAGAVREHFRRRGRDAGLFAKIAAACGCAESEIRAELVNVEHHLAHVASAYYCSPFDSASALSYDGSGDFASLMACKCAGTKIEILDRVTLPASLGFFYTAVCQFIGFDGFGEEYKVMGLAPYGEDRYHEEMKKILVLDDDGWFHFGKGYVAMPNGWTCNFKTSEDFLHMFTFHTEKMRRILGGAPRRRGDPLTQREKDIARSCQVRFEEAAVHCLKRLHKLAPNDNLCMAGGSALNGVANARILRDTPFRNQYLQAAASDEGTCLGAALWAYHNAAGGTKRFHMKHAFWGPAHGEDRIRADLAAAGVEATRFDDPELFGKIVALLRAGKVVGWYQGAGEWGPRALGNRSILADPTNPDMKAIINAKIKRRESFRPFAPSVLAEDVKEYFEQDVYSPFMMHVVKFKPEWRAKLPAVVHQDGTGRLQSVSREFNPRYYDLIRAFKRASGVGILLNTSFNENEPVVDTPAQALDCYLRTDMDALCLGNWLAVK
ncbi:MAG: carbamoyltransferase [Kiritimatiellae bacterium]|nr:carbamoyltransferase [Kiritimatiellia bacterium]